MTVQSDWKDQMRTALFYLPVGLLASFATLYASSQAAKSYSDLSLIPPARIAYPGKPTVARAAKGDRLAPALSAPSNREIATVEVTGGPNVSIAYRDRRGRVLFKTDPSRQLTTVAKGVSIPVATVRVSADHASRHSVGPAQPSSPPPASAPKPKLLSGCDPSFSPIVDPDLAHVAGRCLAAAGNTQIAEVAF